MKVLHVGVGNLGRGGVSTYLDLVAKGQINRGFDVAIVELWPIPGSTSLAPEVLHSLPDLQRKIATFQPDAIHLHSLIPEYDALGANVVITAHDHSPHCPAGSRYLERSNRGCTRPFSLLGCLAGHFWERCGSRSPRSLRNKFRITDQAPSFKGQWIAPSRYASTWMTQRGIDPSRIHLVANPGPFSLCAPPPRPIDAVERFLFVGRLVANKGASVAIEALARTAAPVRLVIVGEGPQKPDLEKLASDLGVADRVDFEGWCPPAQVISHLDSATALLVPSLWPEPFGLVVLEAFSRRCAVIASDTGGLSDLVRHGISGFLVPPGDSHTLARSMANILDQPALRSALVETAALDLTTLYSLELHLDRLEAVYHILSSTRPTSAGKEEPR